MQDGSKTRVMEHTWRGSDITLSPLVLEFLVLASLVLLALTA